MWLVNRSAARWIIQDDLTHMSGGWQTWARVIGVTKAHVSCHSGDWPRLLLVVGITEFPKQRVEKAKSARAFQASACFRVAKVQVAKASLMATLCGFQLLVGRSEVTFQWQGCGNVKNV